MGTLRFDPGLGVYNAFSSHVVLTQNQTFGSSLGRPQKVLQGRLMRLTAQINF